MADEPRDDLTAWCEVREQIDWVRAGAPRQANRTAGDGIRTFVETVVRQRDQTRAEHLLAALDRARAHARAGEALSFEQLAGWLGVPAVFRASDAFAKAGRERYGLKPDTAQQFSRCLGQATEPDCPLAARAARAYLDVAYFHPFPDGNARAGMIALDFVLSREGAGLAFAAPVLMTSRRASDPECAIECARLVSRLLN